MNNITKILNKSIKDLENRKLYLQKELYQVEKGIDSILKTIEDLDDVNTVENKEVKKKTKRRKPSSRRIITEKSIRDAVIELHKNPLIIIKRRYPLDKDCFTQYHVAKVIGINENNPNIKPYLLKLVDKGILERRNYRRGNQYKYIEPSKTGPGIEFEKQKGNIEKNVVYSNVGSPPVSGTGKNSIIIRNKDVEKMLNQAKKQGFIVERLGNDHLRVSKNTGSELGKSATISTTGRDVARYVENCKADLRRIGVDV